MKKTKMLKKNYEFKKVLSKGKYYSGQNIDAFIKDNKKNYNFLGLAISVKTAKAVKRNKIKRLIRENYKEQEMQIKTGKSSRILSFENFIILPVPQKPFCTFSKLLPQQYQFFHHQSIQAGVLFPC